MKILTTWLRSYLPTLHASDAELAEALTLRGIAVEGVFPLTEGSLFEMDITTNRVDAMNHYGIAREAAVIFGLQLLPLDTHLPAAEPGPEFPVRVEAADGCGRFTARVLRGVSIGPSTGEVQKRFGLLGQKQISNAVDATNYVTQAMGQPTHAFDLDAVEGGIVVRRARAGERLKTLDGVERTLHADDLVIADERRVLSLAGVMGGWDSMITPATKNVLVEAAWFDPGSVRRTSKRHGIHTDASHRFERGADFNAAPAASALVSRIILTAGGQVVGPFVDIRQASAEARTVRRLPVRLHMREVRRILGPTDAPGGISGSEATTILLGLGCGVAASDAGALHGAFATHDLAHGTELLEISPMPGAPAVTGEVAMEAGIASRDAGSIASEESLRHPARAHENAASEVGSTSSPVQPSPNPDLVGGGHDDQQFEISLPSWRLDLEREIDLLEEIARVHGYNQFRNTLPAFTGTVRELSEAPAFRVIRNTMLGAGWSEAISSTFVSEKDAQAFAAQPGAVVRMENPLSEEAGFLRPALAPGMLAMLGHNLHRGVEDAALFELGTVFAGHNGAERVEERPSLVFGATGVLGGRTVDFYTAKGIVEALLAKFTSRLHYFDQFPPELGLMPAWLHPRRTARLVMDGATIGFFGQLHPEEAARRKLKQVVVLGELRVDRLLALGLRHPMPRELSRFQPVRRNFSFLLPDAVLYGAVAEAMGGLRIVELKSWEPGEVLRDPERVPQGEYSLLLRTVWQSGERTLQESELQGWGERVQAAVRALGGRLRG